MLPFAAGASDPQVEDGRRALLPKSDSGACDSSVEASGGAFQEYSAEFARLRARAGAQLQALREGASGQGGADAGAMERTLADMEANRRQVQVQIKLDLAGASGEARQVWERRLQEWAQEVARLREDVAQTKHERQRQTLGLPNGADRSAYATDTPERRSAAQSTETLERSSAKLEEARRQIFESESVGQGVLSDLAMQRETIQHVRDNMRTVGAELTSARRGLDRMMRMAQKSRIITCVVAFLLCVGLAFWGLEILGLTLKWNLLLALAAVLLSGALFYFRRRYLARVQLRAAADAAACEPTDFHRAAF